MAKEVPMAKKLSPHETRQIACRAEVDPKTVVRALQDPHSVQPLSLQRIERALHEVGLDALLPDLDGEED
jgi:hypothetical protein